MPRQRHAAVTPRALITPLRAPKISIRHYVMPRHAMRATLLIFDMPRAARARAPHYYYYARAALTLMRARCCIDGTYCAILHYLPRAMMRTHATATRRHATPCHYTCCYALLLLLRYATMLFRCLLFHVAYAIVDTPFIYSGITLLLFTALRVVMPPLRCALLIRHHTPPLYAMSARLNDIDFTPLMREHYMFAPCHMRTPRHATRAPLRHARCARAALALLRADIFFMP